LTAEAEQGLEGGHGRPASVEAEDELVEVDLQMLGGDALVGALQPALEVADGSVNAGQDVVEVLDGDPAGALGAGVVLVAELGEPSVGGPAVGVDAGAGCDSVLHEAAEGVGGGVVDDLHPQSTGACVADLDGNDHQGLGAALPAASQPVLEATDEALVDFDGPGQGGRSGLTMARRSLCNIIHEIS
jgi:hypothetical protein